MQNIKNQKLSILATLIFIFSLSGCAGNNLQDSINNSISSVTKSINDAVGPVNQSKLASAEYTRLEDTRLDGIFLNAPFDESQLAKEQYPRVALTVNSLHPRHDDSPSFLLPLNSTTRDREKEFGGCYSLTAKVWDSEIKRDTVDFRWCYPYDQYGKITYMTLSSWLSFNYLDTRSGWKDTGRVRTEGPFPPKESFPSDLAHVQLIGEPSSIATTINGLMLGSIMNRMGFDYTISEDKRFWVKGFKEARL